MQHWLRPWRAWMGRSSATPRRRQPTILSLALGWEKLGVVVYHEPIPWNADAVLVQLMLQFPDDLPRRKADFALVRPEQPPQKPTALVPVRGGHELLFRFPVPTCSEVAEVVWQDEPLVHAGLTLLTLEQFLDRLQIRQVSVAANLGEVTAACSACVGRQVRGLLAAGVITSPTRLAPLADLDLAVELRETRGGALQRVALKLSGAQLGQKDALLQTAWPKQRRRLGHYSVQWTAGGQVLAHRELRLFSQRQVSNLITVTASYYVFKPLSGGTELLRQPPLDGVGWLGPCFLLRSRVPGLAAELPLAIRARFRDGRPAEVIGSETFLLTDGPCPVLGELVRTQDLGGIHAFELVMEDRLLALLSTTPAPAARFTGEGAFEPPDVEYPWSPAADAELADRLGKLLDH